MKTSLMALVVGLFVLTAAQTVKAEYPEFHWAGDYCSYLLDPQVNAEFPCINFDECLGAGSTAVGLGMCDELCHQLQGPGLNSYCVGVCIGQETERWGC